MKKRVFPLLAALACALTFFAGCREKDKANTAEYVLNKDNKSYTLVFYGGTTSLHRFEINEFNGLPVTKIARLAIQQTNDLREIRIGPNVTEIADWGIVNNFKLTGITVDPANPAFRDIDGVLFSKDRTKLITYPNAKGATFTRDGTVDFEKPAIYAIPEGTVEIGATAFYKCRALGDVSFPSTLRTIGPRAFMFCDRLTELTVGEGLETICVDAFTWCKSEDYGLTKITLPSTLQKIEGAAFYRCEKLRQCIILAPESRVELQEGWNRTQNLQKESEQLKATFAAAE